MPVVQIFSFNSVYIKSLKRPGIMKPCLKTLILYLPVLVTCAVFFSACSGDTSYSEALEENREEIEDPKTREDANFLVEAKSLAILNTKVYTLAADSGYSSALVEFADQHKEAHEEMEKDLDDLARDKDIKLPSEMSDEHNAMYAQLSTAGREGFDRSFVTITKRINDDSRSLFNRNATGANDPDIRAFAARKLDQLQANANAVNDIEKRLLQTYDNSQP